MIKGRKYNNLQLTGFVFDDFDGEYDVKEDTYENDDTQKKYSKVEKIIRRKRKTT